MDRNQILYFSKNCSIQCTNCTVASSVPTVLFLYNGKINSNPYDIANTFDNHFAFIAETMKKKHKIFTQTFLRLSSN